MVVVVVVIPVIGRIATETAIAKGAIMLVPIVASHSNHV